MHILDIYLGMAAFLQYVHLYFDISFSRSVEEKSYMVYQTI